MDDLIYTAVNGFQIGVSDTWWCWWSHGDLAVNGFQIGVSDTVPRLIHRSRAAVNGFQIGVSDTIRGHDKRCVIWL